MWLLFRLWAPVTILVLLGGSYEANAQQKWEEFRAVGAGFRVEFPELPRTDSKLLPSKVGDVPGLLALVSKDDGAEFLAIYANFPPSTFSTDADYELNEIREDNLRAVRGTLLSQSRRVIDGRPALHFTTRFHNGRTTATVLAVLRGQRLYQIICVVPTEQDREDARRFIDSFALLGAE